MQISAKRNSLRVAPAREKPLLAFLMAPWFGFEAGCTSSSTQQDQIIPPEQRSIGLPPPRMQEMERPHSNFLPLYLHVCGITRREGGEREDQLVDH